MIQYLAIIPARFGSTRFPGKPLAMLGDKIVIQHVYERVAGVFSEVYVATDDTRVMEAVLAFGGKAIMTRSDHQSGTDRCFEALCAVHPSWMTEEIVVVNVQGDEPFVDHSQLKSLKDSFQDADVQIATLATPFPADASIDVIKQPNSPKVVIDDNDYALYFSRSVIPYLRGVPESEWPSRHRYLKHLGLYAYRAEVLARLTALPTGSLERCESLEQLRWLQAGFRLKVIETPQETIGIDTPEDLQKAEYFLTTHE